MRLSVPCRGSVVIAAHVIVITSKFIGFEPSVVMAMLRSVGALLVLRLAL